MKSYKFKEEFNIERDKKSRVLPAIINHSLPSSLYKAGCVGHEYNTGNYYYKREGGITYLLAYTNSGHAKLTYEGKVYTLQPKTLTFISLSNPQNCHPFHTTTSEFSCKISFLTPQNLSGFYII